MNDQDANDRLLDTVRSALNSCTPVYIRGGKSKRFLHQSHQATEVDSRDHSGILHLDAERMTIRARAGTLLAEVNQTLNGKGLMLAFEPPSFAPTTTVGGMIACGLAGPRQPWAGAVGKHLLGGKLIDGLGRQRGFGIDATESILAGKACHLLAGSLGKLGLLTEICLKVHTRPACSRTLRLEIECGFALSLMRRWRLCASPISAFCHTGDALYLRLEGSAVTVRKFSEQLGGLEANANFWEELREHQLAFFRDPRPLWRLSLPENAPLSPKLPGAILIDWCGAQRWLKSDVPAAAVRRLAERLGGYACSFTSATELPLRHNPATQQPFLELKKHLDPHHLFGTLVG